MTILGVLKTKTKKNRYVDNYKIYVQMNMQ